MKIKHVDGSLVALELKSTIYIIDIDKLQVFDQNGKQLAIINLDTWLRKNTLWTHGISELKIFVDCYKQGKDSVRLKHINEILTDFIVFMYNNNYAQSLNKSYDVELLGLEAIEKVIIPNLRDNFERVRQENGEVSLELFLRRLKNRLQLLNPHEVRTIEGFLNRLNEQHVDLKMAKPDAALIAAESFISKYETCWMNIEIRNLIDTFKTIKSYQSNVGESSPVLSH